MRQRAGIVWGRMEWTAEGRVKVAAGEYLYVSPGFLLKHDYESDAPPEVMQILSAGLVNLANLEMPALNSARRQPERTPAMAKQPMIFLSDREKAFCSSAGLDAGAFLENKLRKAGVLTLQPAANALNAASQPDASTPAPNAAAVELQERCRAHDRLQSLQEAELYGR